MPSRVFRPGALLACAILLCPLISLGAGTDVVHVTVASASSNKAYDLSFAPSGATPLSIAPLSGSSSVRSIIYIGNEQTSNTDLIAADYSGNRIVRYAGASGPANVFWTYSPTTPGPRYPEGLAADSSGNLYANRGDSGHPQVWVFKRNPVQPVAGGAFLAPVLMADSSSISGYGKVRLLDALIVPAATPGGLGAGDLLVLVNDGRVLRFPAANIGNFLAGGSVGAPITLIAAAQCPRGQTPTGMTLWPADSSLLVATVGGAVLRYTLSMTGSTLNPAAFATGLGLSLGKIRSFIKGGNPYVVFDQPLRGKIFEFGAPPSGGCASLTVACNAPLAVITTVSNPVGLAATDAATPSSACDTTVNPNGCSLLGGQIVIAQNKAPAGATLLVSSCSVDADPRFNATLGACVEGSAAHPNDPHLYADDVCPGYPHTQVPSYLCGASGASGHGFTVAKVTEVGGYPTAPFDLLVSSDLTPAGSAPQCPQLTDGWAPLASEGNIVEVNELGVQEFTELAAGCDGSVGKKPGHSLDLIGMQLNDNYLDGATGWLVDLAKQKFDNLSATVAGLTTTGDFPNISAADKLTLASCVATGKSYLIDGSLPTDDSRYQCAAHQAWSCDSALGVTNPILHNTNQLSLYSELRGRLENLVMHLNTRVRGQPVSATLPPPDPGLPDGGCITDLPPTAPTGLHYSYTGSTMLTVSWTASTDPGPNSTGIGGYNVYLGGALQGSTTGTSYPITLVTTTSAAQFLVEVEAFDNATPTPNVSTRASVTVICYDPDTDHDCDAVHHDHH